MSEALSLDERSAILDAEVMKYARRGYEVRSRTQTAAQLVRPKKFSFIWALLWFLVFGVGILVYVLYYLGKSDQTVYLQVDERGKVVSPNTAGGMWNEFTKDFREGKY